MSFDPYEASWFAAILASGFFIVRHGVRYAKKRREEAERLRSEREAELNRISAEASKLQNEIFSRIGRAYLNRRKYLALKGAHLPAFERLGSRISELEPAYPWLLWFFRDDAFQNRFNAHIMPGLKEQFAPYFKGLDEKGYWLTDSQLESVLTDEDAVLVNAGAGAGKTKTIENKVLHLVRNVGIPIDEVLVLTYSQKSRADMAERISGSLKDSGIPFREEWLKSNVTTFHAFWKRVLESEVGYGEGWPSVARSSVRFSVIDDNSKSRIFDSVVRKMKETLASQELLTEFVLYHLSPQADPKEFDSLDGYYKYTKKGLVTQLRQDGYQVSVKSYGEVVIANFLWANGISVQYEPTDHYYTDSSNQKRAYRPDFFLPDHGVYVEYFWIDSQGRTAPHVTALDYLSETIKKLEWHERCGNRLVDMRYADLERGVPSFLEKLRNELERNGVPTKYVSPKDFVGSPAAAEPLEWVNKMISSFLSLYEESDSPIEFLERKIDAGFDHSNADRNRAFLRLFDHFYGEYKAALKEEGVIDFGDMVRKSAQALVSGVFERKYRRVLIDEFQDISKARASLVKAVLSGSSDCRLFCVGDDWQSIYQFAGSDSSIFANFDAYFWYAKEITLDRTFRFNQGISDVSSAFVTANPEQKKKSLASIDKSRIGKVVVVGKEDDSASYFHRILSDIATKDGNAGRRISVLYLTRYQKWRYRWEPFNALAEYEKSKGGSEEEGDAYSMEVWGVQFDITHMTVHKSKWLESDYVVVDFVDLAEKFSFPSAFEDDPILSLLTNGRGRKGYPYAEERRLFYVAITRWRERAYVAYSSKSDSPFVEWLSEAWHGQFSDVITELGTDGISVPVSQTGKPWVCKLCKGRMVVRKWKTPFLWCENYPRCTHTENAPPPKCPDCKVSMKKTWSKKFERYFWWCPNYPECTRTRSL